MKWNVWSISDADARALVVDEGSEDRCKAGAERRNASAQRLKAGVRFEALPDSQQPEL